MDCRFVAVLALAVPAFAVPRYVTGAEAANAIKATKSTNATNATNATNGTNAPAPSDDKAAARGQPAPDSTTAKPGAKVDPEEALKAALRKSAEKEPAPPVVAPAPAVRVARSAPVARMRPPPTAVVIPPAAPTPELRPAPPAHWSYEGPTGPHAWATLSPEWRLCGSGARQSPIDIRDGVKVELDPVVFDYAPARFRVIDNGHAVQANVLSYNAMRVMGRRFRLVQFHVHSPSEELINGRQFDMVVHLVHKDGEGRLAVVAVLVEQGARQPALQTLLNNLPLEKGEEYPAATPVDLNQLLPQDRRYYTYMGSLTTPPCNEDVLWIVMKQPVQATSDQINLFARIYPMNARPVQEAGNRMIKESN